MRRKFALFLIQLSVFIFKTANLMLPAKRFPDQPFLGIAACPKCGEQWTIFTPHAMDVSPEAQLCCPACDCETAGII